MNSFHLYLLPVNISTKVFSSCAWERHHTETYLWPSVFTPCSCQTQYSHPTYTRFSQSKCTLSPLRLTLLTCFICRNEWILQNGEGATGTWYDGVVCTKGYIGVEVVCRRELSRLCERGDTRRGYIDSLTLPLRLWCVALLFHRFRTVNVLK